jgi:hypothetical protein
MHICVERTFAPRPEYVGLRGLTAGLFDNRGMTYGRIRPGAHILMPLEGTAVL